ncbi:DnaA N-terminal domain-containing protein [Candidatus Finniella inopinata]|uniref:Uncharacterized protein n=1 Tax=Candidatus Finniella inopinata TaxID=1696036 RepID=A0A4Q7DGS7_9PROT|nr:DnaA N-terminal domain-containing protein [Candidatus Finniella inopinata]RZI45480.1 hypothetical protein EQU50_06970 [Candidatus Finniella inopinata]
MSDMGQSRLLLSESSCLLYQPELADKIGRVEALVLQSIHYWINSKNESIGKIHQGKRWIYNSYKAWAEEIHMYSEKTIFRAIRNLEKMGILISESLHAFKGNRTKWYTIIYEKLFSFLDSFPSQEEKKPTDKKMTRWSGHGDQITTENTSDTGLNRASARDPLQPLVEKEQPLAVEVSITEQEPAFSIEEEAFKVLDLINTQLDKPLDIFQPIFKNTIIKRMRTHFGAGKGGLDRFREYCAKWAANAFLMGKKAMRSGDLFRCSIGSILSEKMIEDSWENKGFFQVYAPLTEPTPPTPQEENEMGRRSELAPLPPLTLCDVLESAQTPLDKAVKTRLYKALGDVTYQAWFHTTGFVAKGLKNGELDFFISSGFAREYVVTHYGTQMKKAFEFASYGEQGTEGLRGGSLA